MQQPTFDKSKYCSHGAFIKRLTSSHLSSWSKPKAALITPLPATAPRQKNNNESELQGKDVKLLGDKMNGKYHFQVEGPKKLVSQQLTQPFLYIERIIKKQTVDQTLAGLGKMQPFITSKTAGKGYRRATSTAVARKEVQVPAGYKNLYDFQEDKKKTAEFVFSKLMESDVKDVKDLYVMRRGHKDKAKNKGKAAMAIEVKLDEFVEFMRQIAPRLPESQLKHFFKLYSMNTGAASKQPQTLNPPTPSSTFTVSISALSHNYAKYLRSQLQVTNILSKQALKERYMWLRNYLIEFDSKYPELKKGMKKIQEYEENMRQHFKNIMDSYSNPWEHQIEQLQKELLKPVIKYDKQKKAELTKKVQEFTKHNQQLHSTYLRGYESFLQNYSTAITPSHDLFFTKRTICKLIIPLLKAYPTLTRQMVEHAIGEQQQKKQKYLSCLSGFVVELQRDKNALGQDAFTLQEVVNMVLGRAKNSKISQPELFSQQFMIYSMKKLLNEVKKQYLVKYSLQVPDINEFPSDQQIPLTLFSTCFEMECNKVLLKHKIWSELLNLLPVPSASQSTYHQDTIDGNTCLEFIRKYFLRLDQRLSIELSKSKHVSLMVEDVSLQDFDGYSQIIDGVINGMNEWVEPGEEDQEKADQVKELFHVNKKKVGFADVVDSALMKEDRPEQFIKNQEQEQKEEAVKALLKSIFNPTNLNASNLKTHPKSPKKELSIHKDVLHAQPLDVSLVQNLEMKTLAKSFFVPDAQLNTSSFDIRNYEKQRQQQFHQSSVPQEEFVRLGTSMLLSNLPQIDDLPVNKEDPLRISRFLLSSLDKGVQEKQKILHQKQFQVNIREGVDNNYYNQKIRLQNKPTVYDCEGKSKYSVLFPVAYYEGFVVGENVPDKQKWFLRPHHVQTLTENPLSKKDNVLNTEYQSKMQKLPGKKREDEYVIEANVQRKEELIQSLQERISSLKHDLEVRTSGTSIPSRSHLQGVATVPPALLDNYLTKITADKEDKELEVAAYEGVLYDLRRKERQLLNKIRDDEEKNQGEPTQKWWERKDKDWNNEARKDRLLVGDTGKHRQYVDKLKNKQIY